MSLGRSRLRVRWWLMRSRGEREVKDCAVARSHVGRERCGG